MILIPKTEEPYRWESDGELEYCALLAIDRYNSTATRRQIVKGTRDAIPRDKIVKSAEDVLTHNAIICKVVQETIRNDALEKIYVCIENFVGDNAVISVGSQDSSVDTSDVPKAALKLAREIIKEFRSTSIKTSIGIAYGQILRFRIDSFKPLDQDGPCYGPFETIIGESVDLAIRLSWLAYDNQILTCNQVQSQALQNTNATEGLNDDGDWQFLPDGDAWSMPLDKWPFSDDGPHSKPHAHYLYTDKAESEQSRRPINPRLVNIVDELRRDFNLDDAERFKRWCEGYGRAKAASSGTNSNWDRVNKHIIESNGNLKTAIKVFNQLLSVIKHASLGTQPEQKLEKLVDEIISEIGKVVNLTSQEDGLPNTDMLHDGSYEKLNELVDQASQQFARLGSVLSVYLQGIRNSLEQLSKSDGT